MNPQPEPRLGLFWFVPEHSAFEMKGVSQPLSEVPNLGGFRTVALGHFDVWKAICVETPSLAEFGYEYFPRGRVNWAEDPGEFLLLVDRSIIAEGQTNTVIHSWNLPVEETRVMTDAHYRTHKLTSIIIQ